MREKFGNTIRMMAYEGKSLRQIANKTDLNMSEIEDYLITHGIPVIYNKKDGDNHNKEVKKKMQDEKIRIMGKPVEEQKKKKIPLTEEQKAEIRRLLKSGESVPMIAAKFDRDVSLIYRMNREMNRDMKSAEQTDGELNDKKASTTSTEDNERIREQLSIQLVKERFRNIELVSLLTGVREDIETLSKNMGKDGDPRVIFSLGFMAGKISKAVESQVKEHERNDPNKN